MCHTRTESNKKKNIKAAKKYQQRLNGFKIGCQK